MPKYEKGHSSNEISELFSQCELLSIYVLGDYHCRPVDWILCCEAKFKIGQMYPMAYFRCGKQLHIFERYLSCGVLVSCSSLLIRTVKIRWTLESNFLHFNFHESLHGIQSMDAKNRIGTGIQSDSWHPMEWCRCRLSWKLKWRCYPLWCRFTLHDCRVTGNKSELQQFSLSNSASCSSVGNRYVRLQNQVFRDFFEDSRLMFGFILNLKAEMSRYLLCAYISWMKQINPFCMAQVVWCQKWCWRAPADQVRLCILTWL